MTSVLIFLTALLGSLTALLVLWRQVVSDRKLDKIAGSVNGELDAIKAQAQEMKERAERVALYAAEMAAYAASLRSSLLIIEKAEQAGEQVVSLRATVASTTVKRVLEREEPVMLDP